MQIHNLHQQAETSGLQSAAFGFEMNAKMYDILISKMYTNKPAAVIRELSANAWDAHVDAGNTSTPFELQLPTWLDKTFAIRDYGTGIPHDKFEFIYTNVGSSTKEGTNELIGGFGLGSKAPFTMTDTFFVENWYGGIKTTWVCFKDKGVPQVSKVGEEPSDEPSGLRVMFSFDTKEVDEFTKQVVLQLKYFPVKPVITGGEGDIKFPPLPDGWETKDYFFQNKDPNARSWQPTNSYVVMGNVCYQLSPSNFDYSYRPIFDAGVTLKVPIGSVDIPPSRENIEMTPRTIATINVILNKILTEYAEVSWNRLLKCTTVMEARKVCNDLNRRLLSSEFYDKLVLGVSIRTLSESSFFDVAGHVLLGLYKTRGGGYKYSMKGAAVTSYRDNLVQFCVNDLGRGFRQHIINNADTLMKHSNGGLFIVQPEILNTETHKEDVAKIVAAITAETGSAPLLLSSIIGAVPAKAPKAPTATKKMPPNQLYKLTEVHSGYSLVSRASKYDGDEPEGYFIEIVGSSMVSDVDNLRFYLDNGLLAVLDKPVYLARKTIVPKLTKLQRLDQSVIDKIKPVIIDRAIEQECTIEAFSNTITIRVPDEFVPNIKDKGVKIYIRYAKYIERKRHEFLLSDVRDLAKTFGAKAALQAVHHKPNPKLSKYRERLQDLNELFGQITSTYSEERRKARMAALRSLIN